MDHKAAEELPGLARGAGMELLGVQQATLQRAGREQASGAAGTGRGVGAWAGDGHRAFRGAGCVETAQERVYTRGLLRGTPDDSCPA